MLGEEGREAPRSLFPHAGGRRSQAQYLRWRSALWLRPERNGRRPGRRPLFPCLQAPEHPGAPKLAQAGQAGRRLDCASFGGRAYLKTSSTRHLPTWKVETALFPWQAVGLRVPQRWRRPCGSSCRTVRRRTVAGLGSLCLARRPRTPPVALHKVSGLDVATPLRPAPLASGIVLVCAFPWGCVPLFPWASWGLLVSNCSG